MNINNPTQGKMNKRRNWRKFLDRRSRPHDPMLVLNMSRFNFESGWNRIFSPVSQRENVWC